LFLAQTSQIAYTDPWEAPFELRRGTLRLGQLRVAYFYERPDNSTFRYRVYNMIQALRIAEPAASAAWFCSADLPRMGSVLEQADVLVLCRTRYSDDVARMITRARALGLQILFDVDDLVFDTRYVHLILETLDQRLYDAAWDFWFAYIGRIGAVLRLCDAAIVTNGFLADRVGDFCGLTANVVPNFLNQEQVSLSRRILEAKVSTHFARDGRIHLGYFSGTPTHNRDFDIIAGVLERALQADSRVILRVVGFLDVRNRFHRHLDRIEILPLQDFLNLQRLIGETEFNLIPLQDNTFTNCKSELKVFEAAAVGTLSIASPTYTLSRAIRDGSAGYLAVAQAWERTLLEAIDRLDDYCAMAVLAAQHALDRFAPDQHGAALRAALSGTRAAPNGADARLSGSCGD
jgi:glycosyltransferase involved in cell wall biosynthesis